MVELRNITKRYNGAEKDAVRNLSLRIETGGIYGLLGTNGAGKTTVFSMLCGLRSLSSGDIFIDGLNTKTHISEIKKIIGIVPQDIALFPDLSVYENLRYFGRMYGIRRSELEKRIDESLNNFELSESKYKAVKTRSGGMKRRINLIAGILHRPKFLLLDEPAVGIDARTRLQIMQYLKKINNQSGTTILYTSHYLKEAEDFCTKTGIISEGELIEEGTPEVLVKKYNCKHLEQAFLHITEKPATDKQ